MQSLQEKKILIEDDSALDADSSPYAVAPNAWINMQNMRIATTDKNATNAGQFIGGTKLLSIPQPSINYLTIGTCVDEENGMFVKFQFNTTGRQDRIVAYYKNFNIEYDVLLSSQVIGGLNFSKRSLIHSAVIIKGMLYWVDGENNQPRKINLQSAIKANNPSFVTDQRPYTFPINFSEITLIKPPPVYAPGFVKFNDSAVLANLIASHSFQFAFQYIYYDNERTTIGLYSAATEVNIDSENFNSISVTMRDFFSANWEFIPNTVRIVRLIVRRQNGVPEGSDIANVIKTWDKEILAQAAEIAANNAQITALNYLFYNNVNGEAIAKGDVLKAFDSVPIFSDTLAYANQRLFLGNNTEGYNVPKSTSLSITKNLILSPFGTGTPVYMDMATYNWGMNFYDFAMRKCSVVTNESLIMTTPIRVALTATVVDFITWTLSNANAVNEIPAEAYYYAPDRTLNQRTRFFIDSISITSKYATKDANGDYVFTSDTYTPPVVGIGLNTTALVQAGLGYTFSEGDLCLLTLRPTPGTVYGVFPVIGQVGNYIIIKAQNIGDLSTLDLRFQIYTPYNTSENEPYYELPAMYKVLNPGQPTRSYQTLTGTFFGDAFIVDRNLTGIGATVPYQSYAMSRNDAYYKQWNISVGKVNVVSQLGQVKKTQYFRWSNTFTPNTAINGLSTFDSLDQIPVSEDCGSITKLILTSKAQIEGIIMLCICAIETNSVYLGESQIIDSTGATQFFTQSKGVVSTINVLKGSFGTINPESVIEYRGRVYFYSAITGKYIQYSENGLFAISDYKMTRFWNQFTLEYQSLTQQEIEDLGGRPFIFSTIDPNHNELLISIPKLSNDPPKGYLPDYPNAIYPFDILDFQGKTIVYKLDFGVGRPKWMGSYSFNPEYFVVLQNELYGFKNGHTYLHNQSNYNEFYGILYSSKIMMIANKEISKPKIYYNVSSQSNLRPNFCYFYNNYPIQQSSDLVDNDFAEKEGAFFAAIFRNKLIPTVDGFTTDGLLTGEVIRNAYMFVMIEWRVGEKPLSLEFINIGYSISRGIPV